MPDNRDELDRLVDSALATYADPGPDSDLERRVLNRIATETALATYADPGPDSGLEQRILSRIAAEAVRSSRRPWLGWSVALPFAAACLLLFILFSRPRTNHPAAKPEANVARRPVTPSIETASHPAAHSTPNRHSETPLGKQRPRLNTLAAKSAPLPKLDVFPTPQPLTSQERALAAYVAHMPLAEQQSLARPRQNPVPLNMASIRTLPMETPDMVFLGPPSEGKN